jgi:hypothetical protein
MPALARARIGDMTMFLPNEIAPRHSSSCHARAERSSVFLVKMIRALLLFPRKLAAGLNLDQVANTGIGRAG